MSINLIISARLMNKADFESKNPVLELNEFAISKEGYESSTASGVKLGDGQKRWSDLPYLTNLTPDLVMSWLEFFQRTNTCRLVTLPATKFVYTNISDTEPEDALTSLLPILNQVQGLTAAGKNEALELKTNDVGITVDAATQASTNINKIKLVCQDGKAYEFNIRDLESQQTVAAFQTEIEDAKTVLNEVQASVETKYDKTDAELLQTQIQANTASIEALKISGVDLSGCVLSGGVANTY